MINNLEKKISLKKPHISFKTSFNVETDQDQQIFLLKKSLLNTILKKIHKLRNNYAVCFSDADIGFLTLIVYVNEFFVLKVFNKKLLITRNGITELLIDENNTVQNSIFESVIENNYDFIAKLLNFSNVFANSD